MSSPPKLVKLHGLGNDFLVAFADDEPDGFDDLARRLCHRTLGVGADGLLVAMPATAGGDHRMAMRNADGSFAEMSGNGIRCFVHAVARSQGITCGQMQIETDAGIRKVDFKLSDDMSSSSSSVAMGPVGPGPALPSSAAVAGRWRSSASIGNPHLVVALAEEGELSIADVGPAWDAETDGGVNVHLVAPVTDTDVLDISIWERGAGPTQACGTGASVVAWLMAQRGEVGSSVAVRMAGGSVQVDMSGEEPVLTGPAVYIADLEVSASLLSSESNLRSGAAHG